MHNEKSRRRIKIMNENLLEKVLMLVAKATSESTSIMFLYEPKVPDMLIEDKKEK